ncbi:MAG: hypothetical protein ACXWCU_13465, partial [Caldimonas sp.]
ASLEGEARMNKVRIRELGRRFGIATRETSLLVLERVDDYVRHEIEPPPALCEAYDRLAATMQKGRAQSDAARLAQVVQRFEARVAWWNREFPKGEPPAPLAIAKAESRGVLGATLEMRRERADTDATSSNKAAERQMPPAPMSAAAPPAARMAAAPREAEKKDGGAASPATASISIALQPAKNNAVGMKRLEAAEPATRRAVYLDERSANAMNVGFFLDAAEFFLNKGERALGLRALSNLAELDLQNRQVLRLLAYRLQQAGEVGLALPIF